MIRHAAIVLTPPLKRGLAWNHLGAAALIWAALFGVATAVLALLLQ